MNINTNRWLIPRRTLLKGLGVSVALPWLEVMSENAKSITTAGSMALNEIPRRTMFTYWGLGVEIEGFTPPDTGRNYTLTPSLAPLAPFKDDCTLLTELTSFFGGHGSCSCLLTGVNTPRNAKTLISVDQQLAMHHGSATRFPSLVLGTGLVDFSGQFHEPALQGLSRRLGGRAIEGIGQPHRRQLLLPTGAVVADGDDTDAVASGKNLDHPRARGRGRLGEYVRERPEDDPFDGAFQGTGAVARVVADAGKEIDDGPIDIDLEAAPRDPAAEEDGANFALCQLPDVGPVEWIEDDDPAEPVDELRPEELPYRLPDPVLGRRRRGLDKPESTRRRLPRAQIAREDDD
jgi:hypothetical protein